MDSLAPHLALFNEEYIPGPQSSMGMHSQQRDTDDLFANALSSHFVDSFSADACYSMDRMDQTFSMLEPQRQRSTDSANSIFDNFDNTSEQSFGDAISVDSFDFDILDSQDSCGTSNPVSTSTPLNQPFSCDFGATSFAPSGSTDALDPYFLPTAFARQPAGIPQQRCENRAQSVQSRMTRLRLSPLETIEITHTASNGSLPKRKRNVSYRNLHAYGVGEPVEPAARPAPTSRELVSCAAREDSRRSCKRQTKESAVAEDRYMYVCHYCRRHKLSASKGQDGRVRIRCECGGRHRDGTPRMHAQWSAANGDDQESH